MNRLSLQNIEKSQNDQEIQSKILRKFKNDHYSYSFIDQTIDPNDMSSIKVLCLTWNLQGGLPRQPLNDIFKAEHHIIVVSTQECQRSIAASICCSSKDIWEKMLQTQLTQKYAMIKSHTMNAMHIALFAHVKIKNRIKLSHGTNIATGFINSFGNKGATAIAIKIDSINLLFINSHLQSGHNRSIQRSKEFQSIETNLKIEHQILDDVIQLQHKISDNFDQTIWMGDFNFRISTSLINEQEIKEKLLKQDFLGLLKYDQFIHERERIGKNQNEEKFDFFETYQEGFISFPPTYKLKPQENAYDEVNWRIPGWTDRIIYKDNEYIELKNYDSIHSLFGSDHRPVIGQFEIKMIKKQVSIIPIKEGRRCEIF